MNQGLRKVNEPLPKADKVNNKASLRPASRSRFFKRAARRGLPFVLFGIIMAIFIGIFFPFLKGAPFITLNTPALLAEYSLFFNCAFVFITAVNFFALFPVEIAWGATRKQSVLFFLLTTGLASAASVILFIILGGLSILVGSETYASGLPVIFAVNLYLLVLILSIIFSLVTLKLNKIVCTILVIFMEPALVVIVFFSTYSVYENLMPSVLLNDTFAGSPFLTIILAAASVAAIKLMFIFTRKTEVRV